MYWQAYDVPRKGNVDRNCEPGLYADRATAVDVPRKGNVDRNEARPSGTPRKRDVPRKGNVDRNFRRAAARRKSDKTFPARGTWIEIRKTGSLTRLWPRRRSPQGERG